MNGVVDGFVVIGIVIVVGYLLGRSGLLGPGSVEVLSRLAFFVASPALLFVTLAQADVSAVFSEALVVTAVSSSLACLLYLPVGLLRRRPPGETAVGSMASGYVNAGNLGIPIATYALGNAAEVAPVMLFQLTVLAPLFSTVLDLTSARADGERPPLLRTLTAPLRNPIALASAAGLLVSATGLRVPGAVLAPVSRGAGPVRAVFAAEGRARPQRRTLQRRDCAGDHREQERHAGGHPRRAPVPRRDAGEDGQARAGVLEDRHHHRRQILPASPTARPPWCSPPSHS